MTVDQVLYSPSKESCGILIEAYFIRKETEKRHPEWLEKIGKANWTRFCIAQIIKERQL